MISASGTMLIELRETQQRPLQSMKGQITKKERKNENNHFINPKQNKASKTTAKVNEKCFIWSVRKRMMKETLRISS